MRLVSRRSTAAFLLNVRVHLPLGRFIRAALCTHCQPATQPRCLTGSGGGDRLLSLIQGTCTPFTASPCWGHTNCVTQHRLTPSGVHFDDMRVEKLKYTIWAAEPSRAVRFYIDCFGATQVSQNPHITELAVAGGLISIHGGGEGNNTWTGLTHSRLPTW